MDEKALVAKARRGDRESFGKPFADRYTSMKFDDETERCAYVGNTIYLFAQNYDDSSAVQIDSVDYKFTQNYDNSAVQIDNVADK